MVNVFFQRVHFPLSSGISILFSTFVVITVLELTLNFDTSVLTRLCAIVCKGLLIVKKTM